MVANHDANVIFYLLGGDQGDQGKEQIPAESKREEGKKPERC